jgi:hypothetical protein
MVNKHFIFAGLLVIGLPAAVLSQTPNSKPGAPTSTSAPAPPTAQGTAPAPMAAPTTAPTGTAPPPTAAAAPPTGKSLSQSLGMLVYPTKEQTATQQSKDEYDCYNWSKTQSGYDPMTASVPSQSAQQSTAQQPAQQASGQPVRGAMRGAAGGAAIGAVAGNAGKGAAIGATVGALKGGADKRQAQAQQQQAAEQQQSAQAQAKAAEQQNLDVFKRGLGACLEGKGYTVK